MTQAVASNPTFGYCDLNMEYTRSFHMHVVAEQVSAFVYAVPLVLIALVEAVIKNGLFLAYNAIAFTLNTVIDIAVSVSELAQACFCCDDEGDEGQTSSLRTYFGGEEVQPAQPVRIITTEYKADDLITFKAALRVSTSSDSPAQVRLAHLLYRIWFDQATDTVHIRESNQANNRTLVMKITDGGQVTSIRLDRVDQEQFPVDFGACMFPCFQKALEVSSKYEVNYHGHINVRTLRKSVLEVPAFHLQQMINQLADTLSVPSIRVTFLNSDLTESAGIDAGGLRRDFMDDLMKGMTRNCDDLRFATGNGQLLKMPVVAGAGPNNLLPTLSEPESEIYDQIGQIMVFAHQAQGNLMIGSVFEEALYSAAFSLTDAELNTPFNLLRGATHLKMARKIFEARETPTRPIDLIENQALTQEEWDEAHAIAQMSDGWQAIEGFTSTNAIHRTQVKDGLKKLLWEEVGSYLDPIHTIAKGMKVARSRWGVNMNGVTYRTFCDKIQGTIDRQAVADSFQITAAAQYVTNHLQNQVTWLREWVLDPQTSLDDIRELIKFATGGSSLRRDQRINVSVQSETSTRLLPFPQGHSCFGTIDLAPRGCSYGQSNNWTKDAFIQSLRVPLANSGDYSMG